MSHEHDERESPRWLRLASSLRAEPAPDTLARVRARLAASQAEPGWLRWLARPVTVAASAALLVTSTWVAVTVFSPGAGEEGESVSLTSALLDDDGNLGFHPSAIPGESSADSEAVTP